MTLLNLMVGLEDLASSRADKMKLTSANIQGMHHLNVRESTLSEEG